MATYHALWIGCKPFRAKKYFVNQSMILVQFCLLNPNMVTKMVNSKVKGSWAALKISSPVLVYYSWDVKHAQYAYNMTGNWFSDLMKQKIFEYAHTKFEIRGYLKMRRRNLNFKWKFEIVIRFRVEWYIMMMGFICLCPRINWIRDCVGVESKFQWKLLHMSLNQLTLYTLRREI